MATAIAPNTRATDRTRPSCQACVATQAHTPRPAAAKARGQYAHGYTAPKASTPHASVAIRERANPGMGRLWPGQPLLRAVPDAPGVEPRQRRRAQGRVDL